MQIAGPAQEPLAFGHPAFRAPSCDPSIHPKRDASLGSRPVLCAAAQAGAPSTRPKKEGRIFGRIGAAKRPHFFKCSGMARHAGSGGRAFFELSTRINAVQRSQGDSATARAAYRACCVIECEREGKTHDYSRKGGHEAGQSTCRRTRRMGQDRAKLWNGAEKRERNKDKRAKCRSSRRRPDSAGFDVHLSRRIVERGQAESRADHCPVSGQHVTASAVDFNIHEPGKDGDERNHHCHMMFTTRRMTAKGFGEKARNGTT